MAGADAFTVEQHRRFVLLAFADDNDTIHLNGIEHQSHRVDGRLIRRDLVSPTDPTGRRQGRGLGDPY